LLAAMCSACSAVRVKEPSDAALRGKFELHRQVLEELRQLFGDDVKRHTLTFVTATDVKASACEDRRAGEDCLSAARWSEYAQRLTIAGIERIERHETPGIYFHVYRSPYWGADSGCVFKGEDFGDCFKFRGLVYAPGHPTVDHSHDDFETRIDIGGGWYSYLILDT
jgi:hypothetical protein